MKAEATSWLDQGCQRMMTAPKRPQAAGVAKATEATEGREKEHAVLHVQKLRSLRKRQELFRGHLNKEVKACYPQKQIQNVPPA